MRYLLLGLALLVPVLTHAIDAEESPFNFKYVKAMQDEELIYKKAESKEAQSTRPNIEISTGILVNLPNYQKEIEELTKRIETLEKCWCLTLSTEPSKYDHGIYLDNLNLHTHPVENK